jgi:glucose-6-phosphate dehydrogenase assembly protein OpcA
VATPVTSGVWSAQNTNPDAIDAALRRLMVERAAEERLNAPARVLNLVVVVDREWKGEVANRLERVGRYHPSRTIMCAVEPRRTTLDAWATIVGDEPDDPHAVGRAREQIEIDVGEKHLAHLDTIVDPVLVAGVTTVVWAPHQHRDAVDSLLGLSDAVLIDSIEAEEAEEALTRAEELAARTYVVDLAWLRTTPWRERIAATFDPPAWRGALAEISSVIVRHHPDSTVAGLLLLGWMASRLGWRVSRMSWAPGSPDRHGRARSRKGEVSLRLHVDPSMPVPGLSGVTLETASGVRLSLDRGPGGLKAYRRDRKGREEEWSVLGASRGEGGILGEGVRQALLRDPTYGSALAAARGLES